MLYMTSSIVGLKDTLELFRTAADDVAPVVASYPGLVAAVLATPVRKGEMEDMEAKPGIQRNGVRSILFSTSGPGDNECILVWNNAHADVTLPDDVLPAFSCYGDNVANLPALPAKPPMA